MKASKSSTTTRRKLKKTAIVEEVENVEVMEVGEDEDID